MANMILIILALIVIIAVWWRYSRHPAQPPRFNTAEWWGPKELKGKVDESIKPFQVKFDEAMVKDLKTRLKRHKPFTPSLEGAAFDYGFNSKTLDSWVKYWAEEYPFEAREKFLNQFSQYKTSIQGLDIHFIRVKPKVPAHVQVVPLLLMHGWPGSVVEFYEAIPLLTKQMPGYDFAFEVIAPSLPGYGFSDGAVRPGLGPPQIAVIFRNLMHRLGFMKFYIQGGDWGSVIAISLATIFPDDILGHHNNMLHSNNPYATTKILLGSFFPSLVVEPHLADRLYPLYKYFEFYMEEFGYMHLQATKPDTVGYALADSPVGLLAYILEKFYRWTVRDFKILLEDNGLTKKYNKDQLIDNIMIYWCTNSITTSMRLYAEKLSYRFWNLKLNRIPSHVPTWALQAKHELTFQPKSLLKYPKYPNLLNVTILEEGGHFLAFELPQVFAEDVFRAVKAFREFHAQEMKKKTEL